MRKEMAEAIRAGKTAPHTVDNVDGYTVADCIIAEEPGNGRMRQRVRMKSRADRGRNRTAHKAKPATRVCRETEEYGWTHTPGQTRRPAFKTAHRDGALMVCIEMEG